MCKGACRVVFIGIASTYGVLRHVHHNSHVESTTGESIDRLADGRHGTARGGEEEKRVKIGRNKKMKHSTTTTSSAAAQRRGGNDVMPCVCDAMPSPPTRVDSSRVETTISLSAASASCHLSTRLSAHLVNPVLMRHVQQRSSLTHDTRRRD